MRRREFMTVIGGMTVAWPLSHLRNNPSGSGCSIRVLIVSSSRPSSESSENWAIWKARTSSLSANSRQEIRLKEFAADLVQQHVDVIVTIGTPAGFAAQQATSTIPIVFGAISDPVGVGLVASLSRPGGNATGNSLMSPELSAKRLEILRSLAPKSSRFAILWDSSNPGMAQRVRETEIAADQSHVLLHTAGPRTLEELEAAFSKLLDQRPDALLVTTEAFTRQHRTRILDFAKRNRIPAMFEDGSYVEAGGLMSYGPDYDEVFRTAAVLVSKILKGAKPADLPIEQPTKFQLVINLKTARTLEIEIPSSLLVMADRIIE